MHYGGRIVGFYLPQLNKDFCAASAGACCVGNNSEKSIPARMLNQASARERGPIPEKESRKRGHFRLSWNSIKDSGREKAFRIVMEVLCRSTNKIFLFIPDVFAFPLPIWLAFRILY
ncbi:hypothetical protein CDAR_289701 [Caerostris darwini]|uniref:Uncharacterized protein n=1 Tax=Caerostris darwini TaxID=1538125 RepID=A0AAV4WYI1_9ARAC|nr:hypothetical protein CDAR_289701 [Caerostris darwini]